MYLFLRNSFSQIFANLDVFSQLFTIFMTLIFLDFSNYSFSWFLPIGGFSSTPWLLGISYLLILYIYTLLNFFFFLMIIIDIFSLLIKNRVDCGFPYPLVLYLNLDWSIFIVILNMASIIALGVFWFRLFRFVGC